MRIASVEVENWTRYKGVHELAPPAAVHAVVARHVDDEDRSNWLGKTSLLHAVPFALFGRKPPSARVEDDWIYEGEKTGRVLVKLDDGTVVMRKRDRGKRTSLEVHLGGKTLNGKEAQRALDEHVGLAESDFFVTCFFEQKKMARFITAQPADRHKVVAGWLNLAPLADCAGNVAKRLSELVDERAEGLKRVEVLAGLIAAKYGELAPGEATSSDLVVQQIEATIEVRANAKDDLHDRASAAQEKVDEYSDWMVHAQMADDYERVVAEGKELREEILAAKPRELEERVGILRERRDEAVADEATAVQEYADAKQYAAGEFDGECPVMCEACPVAGDVSKKAEKNVARLDTAKKQLKLQREIKSNTDADLEDCDAKLLALKKKNVLLDSLREKAVAWKPAHDEIAEDGRPPQDSDDLAAASEEAWTAYNNAVLSFQAAEAALEQVHKWNDEREEILESHEDLDARIATHREAAVIFGRGGAQRRIAEAALDRMEADANELLAEGGIDLSLKVLWSREASSGLATTCDSCGSPFPSSQKVKVCAGCGADRGPKTVDKLDIDLSDTSGGAEDLAGVAFQLAAAAWLRRQRDAGWSVAFIDEPFGSLDGANKRALSTHLATMLSGRYGFEQSFVVAHDRSITDALPARVEVAADDEKSWLQGGA